MKTPKQVIQEWLVALNTHDAASLYHDDATTIIHRKSAEKAAVAYLKDRRSRLLDRP